MADSPIRNYVFGIIVFMAVITGVASLFYAIAKAEPQSISLVELHKFNGTFNRQQQLSLSVDAVQRNIESSNSTNFGAFGIIDSLVGTSWQSIKNLFSSFSFMKTVLDGLTSYFGVPGWIPATLILLITTLIGFAIYRLVFQGEI